MSKHQRPVIGISSSIYTLDSGRFVGRDRAYVGQDYVRAVEKAGGVPIILPIIEDPDLTRKQVSVIDGLLLSGGYDILPSFYNETSDRLLEATYPPRDTHEILLAQQAMKESKPILGICRGLQLLNVAFGGTLYQDLTHQAFHPIQHIQMTRPEFATHAVKVLEKTLLQKIMKKKTLMTNSYHHQSVKDLASGFKINAYAEDGTIEGIEKEGNLFVLGVQWHPELMFDYQKEMLKLFSTFIQASQVRRPHAARK